MLFIPTPTHKFLTILPMTMVGCSHMPVLYLFKKFNFIKLTSLFSVIALFHIVSILICRTNISKTILIWKIFICFLKWHLGIWQFNGNIKNRYWQKGNTILIQLLTLSYLVLKINIDSNFMRKYFLTLTYASVNDFFFISLTLKWR